MRFARIGASLIGLSNESFLHLLSHTEVRNSAFWNRYEHSRPGITASAGLMNLERKTHQIRVAQRDHRAPVWWLFLRKWRGRLSRLPDAEGVGSDAIAAADLGSFLTARLWPNLPRLVSLRLTCLVQ
jgi:hypothetical protein